MSTSAFVVVSLSTLMDALLCVWLLLRPRSARVDVMRVARTVAVVGTLGALKCLGALVVGHSYFLVVSLVYADLMLVVPVCGFLLLAASRKRDVTKPVRILALASLLLVPIFVDATFIEPYRLVTETRLIPLARERKMTTPLVIGVLADVQCTEVTEREREAVTRVMAAKPDLILIPGDLQQVGFEHRAEIAAQLRALFAPLAAPLGVWYVEGNTEDTAQARQLLAGSPVRILDNEIVRLEHHGTRVALCGVDLGFDSPAARSALHAIESEAGEDDVRLVVAHRPDVAFALRPHSRVDLVVAGHTHGGQVQLPLFGPPITLSGVPRRVAAGGLSELDGRRIYVSRGIGWEHGHAPRVRFLCAPEVSLLTLERGP